MEFPVAISTHGWFPDEEAVLDFNIKWTQKLNW